MGAEWTGPSGQEPPEREQPVEPRPYGTRPYGTRPYGTRPYGTRPYGTRPYGTRPYGTRPHGTRPYGTRPYGTRGDEPDGPPFLDALEWTDDVADLVRFSSAVMRLGARVVLACQELPVPAVESPLGTTAYLPRPAVVDQAAEGEPSAAQGVGKHSAGVTRHVLRPLRHELALIVVLPDDLVPPAVVHPEVAWAVKQDIAVDLAVHADRAFLSGDGNVSPRGIAATPGCQLPGQHGDLLALMRAMVAHLRARPGAGFRSPGWILSAATLAELSVLGTHDGRVHEQHANALDMTRLLTYDDTDGGTFLGIPFILTPAADDRIFLSSDWTEAWIAADADLVTVAMSADARFESDETLVRAVMHHDFALRRPRSFVWAQRPAA